LFFIVDGINATPLAQNQGIKKRVAPSSSEDSSSDEEKDAPKPAATKPKPVPAARADSTDSSDSSAAEQKNVGKKEITNQIGTYLCYT